MNSSLVRSIFFVCISAVMASMAGGCAFGDRHVSLTYQPLSEPAAQSSGRAAITPFSDERRDPLVVGEVRNGYGMKTAKVLIDDQDAGAWLANAVSDELKRSGIEVVKIADANVTNELAIVTGSLQHLYTKSYMSHRCTVRAKILVTQYNVPVLSREYEGHSKVGAAFAGTSEYERAMEAALHDLLRQAVPDIIKALQ